MDDKDFQNGSGFSFWFEINENIPAPYSCPDGEVGAFQELREFVNRNVLRCLPTTFEALSKCSVYEKYGADGVSQFLTRLNFSLYSFSGGEKSLLLLLLDIIDHKGNLLNGGIRLVYQPVILNYFNASYDDSVEAEAKKQLLDDVMRKIISGGKAGMKDGWMYNPLMPEFLMSYAEILKLKYPDIFKFVVSNLPRMMSQWKRNIMVWSNRWSSYTEEYQERLKEAYGLL